MVLRRNPQAVRARGRRAAVLEVPVRVAREADHRRRVAGRAHLDAERVPFEPVGDARVERTREALVAGHAAMPQLDGGVADRLGLPYGTVEADRAPVQAVRAFVRDERVAAPVEREARVRDAIRVAADDPAEVRVRSRVGAWIVEAEHHVAEASARVGRDQPHQRRAVREDLGFEAARAA